MIGQPGREGFSTVTPYLMVEHVDPVVQFLQDAFEATEVYRSTGSAGGLHVEVQIGDAKIMLGGDTPHGSRGVPTMLFLYVEDTDAVHAAALQAGATEMMPPEDGNFEAARGSAVTDPFGSTWFIATA